MKTMLAYVFVLLALAVTARAEDTYPGDTEFIKRAAMGGMFEMKAGKLAVEKAASQDVKVFGALMIADHAKVNDSLQLIAKNKGWTLPERLGTTQQAKLDQFAELKPADFDREYSAEMAQAHKMNKESFKNAAKFAADQDLKAWAAGVENVIDQHLKVMPTLTDTTTVIIVK